MSERELLFQIRSHVGALPGVALFRNQSGTAERDGRTMRFGLTKGAADLIGIVAPHGRFLALEVKTKTGRPTKEQLMFVELVNKLGGVGRIVRSVEEAETAVEVARGVA